MMQRPRILSSYNYKRRNVAIDRRDEERRELNIEMFKKKNDEPDCEIIMIDGDDDEDDDDEAKAKRGSEIASKAPMKIEVRRKNSIKPIDTKKMTKRMPPKTNEASATVLCKNSSLSLRLIADTRVESADKPINTSVNVVRLLPDSSTKIFHLLSDSSSRVARLITNSIPAVARLTPQSSVRTVPPMPDSSSVEAGQTVGNSTVKTPRSVPGSSAQLIQLLPDSSAKLRHAAADSSTKYKRIAPKAPEKVQIPRLTQTGLTQTTTQTTTMKKLTQYVQIAEMRPCQTVTSSSTRFSQSVPELSAKVTKFIAEASPKLIVESSNFRHNTNVHVVMPNANKDSNIFSNPTIPGPEKRLEDRGESTRVRQVVGVQRQSSAAGSVTARKIAPKKSDAPGRIIEKSHVGETTNRGEERTMKIHHVPWSEEKSQEEKFFAESQKTLVSSARETTSVDHFGIAKRALSLAKKAAANGPQARVELVDVRSSMSKTEFNGRIIDLTVETAKNGNFDVETTTTTTTTTTNKGSGLSKSTIVAGKRKTAVSATTRTNKKKPRLSGLAKMQARLKKTLACMENPARKRWRALCIVCKKRFFDKYEFHRHATLSHPGVRIVFCELCSASFCTDDELTQHRTFYHKITVGKDEEASTSVIVVTPDTTSDIVELGADNRKYSKKSTKNHPRVNAEFVAERSRLRENFRSPAITKKKIAGSAVAARNLKKIVTSCNVAEKRRRLQTKNKSDETNYNYIDVDVMRHDATIAKDKFKSAEVKKLIVPITRLEGPVLEKYMKKLAAAPIMNFASMKFRERRSSLANNVESSIASKTRKISVNSRLRSNDDASTRRSIGGSNSRKMRKMRESRTNKREERNLTISRNDSIRTSESNVLVAPRRSTRRRIGKKSIWSESDETTDDDSTRILFKDNDDDEKSARKRASMRKKKLRKIEETKRDEDSPFCDNFTPIEIDEMDNVAEIVREERVIRKLVSRSSFTSSSTLENNREKNRAANAKGSSTINDATESSCSPMRKISIYTSTSDEDTASEQRAGMKKLRSSSSRDARTKRASSSDEDPSGGSGKMRKSRNSSSKRSETSSMSERSLSELAKFSRSRSSSKNWPKSCGSDENLRGDGASSKKSRYSLRNNLAEGNTSKRARYPGKIDAEANEEMRKNNAAKRKDEEEKNNDDNDGDARETSDDEKIRKNEKNDNRDTKFIEKMDCEDRRRNEKIKDDEKLSNDEDKRLKERVDGSDKSQEQKIDSEDKRQKEESGSEGKQQKEESESEGKQQKEESGSEGKQQKEESKSEGKQQKEESGNEGKQQKEESGSEGKEKKEESGSEGKQQKEKSGSEGKQQKEKSRGEGKQQKEESGSEGKQQKEESGSEGKEKKEKSRGEGKQQKEESGSEGKEKKEESRGEGKQQKEESGSEGKEKKEKSRGEGKQQKEESGSEGKQQKEESGSEGKQQKEESRSEGKQQKEESGSEEKEKKEESGGEGKQHKEESGSEGKEKKEESGSEGKEKKEESGGEEKRQEEEIVTRNQNQNEKSVNGRKKSDEESDDENRRPRRKIDKFDGEPSVRNDDEDEVSKENNDDEPRNEGSNDATMQSSEEPNVEDEKRAVKRANGVDEEVEEKIGNENEKRSRYRDTSKSRVGKHSKDRSDSGAKKSSEKVVSSGKTTTRGSFASTVKKTYSSIKKRSQVPKDSKQQWQRVEHGAKNSQNFCTVCKELYALMRKISSQIAERNISDTPIKCPLCQRYFISMFHLELHVSTNHLRCPNGISCKKLQPTAPVSSSSSSLSSSTKKLCQDAELDCQTAIATAIECPRCPMKFKAEKYLNDHIIAQHEITSVKDTSQNESPEYLRDLRTSCFETIVREDTKVNPRRKTKRASLKEKLNIFASRIDKNNTDIASSMLVCSLCDAKFAKIGQYICHVKEKHGAYESSASLNRKKNSTRSLNATDVNFSLFDDDNRRDLTADDDDDKILPTGQLESVDQMNADREYLLKQLLSDDSCDDENAKYSRLARGDCSQENTTKRGTHEEPASVKIVGFLANLHTCDVCRKSFKRAQDLLIHGLRHVDRKISMKKNHNENNEKLHDKKLQERQELFVDSISSRGNESFHESSSVTARDQFIPRNENDNNVDANSDDDIAIVDDNVEIREKIIAGTKRTAKFSSNETSPRVTANVDKVAGSSKRRKIRFVEKSLDTRNDALLELMETEKSLADVGKNEKLPIACDKCNRHFANRSLLNEHLFFLHDDSLKDTVLTDVLTPIGGLRGIDENELPERWHCDECVQNFKLFQAYSRHRYFVHGDDSMIHICENCSKVLTNVTMVNVHICMDMASYNCRTCNEKFSTGMSLRLHNTDRHMETKGPHICEPCKKSFLTNSMLERHARNDHRIFRPYRARKSSPIRMAMPDEPAIATTTTRTNDQESERKIQAAKLRENIDNEIRNELDSDCDRTGDREIVSALTRIDEPIVVPQRRGRWRACRDKKIPSKQQITNLSSNRATKYRPPGKRRRGRPRKYPRSDDDESPYQTSQQDDDEESETEEPDDVSRSDTTTTTTLYVDENEFHQCSICQLYCLSRSALRNHMYAIHSANDEMCQLCQNMYPTGKLIRHMIDRHVSSDGRFSALTTEIRWKIGTNFNELDTEIFVKMLGIDRLVSLCEYRRYAEKNDLASYPCSHCEKILPSNELYRYHFLLNHDVMCAICNIEYKRGHDAARHKSEIHGSVGRYIWFADRTIMALSSTKNFADVSETIFMEMLTKNEIDDDNDEKYDDDDDDDDKNAENEDSLDDVSADMKNLDCTEILVWRTASGEIVEASAFDEEITRGRREEDINLTEEIVETIARNEDEEARIVEDFTDESSGDTNETIHARTDITDKRVSRMIKDGLTKRRWKDEALSYEDISMMRRDDWRIDGRDDGSIVSDDFAEPEDRCLIIVVTDDDLERFDISTRHPNIWGLAAKISSTHDDITPKDVKEMLERYFERDEDFDA